MSLYTELLQTLGQYSAAVDTGAATHSDFIEFQRLEVRITRAYQNGYYKHPEYRTLIACYQYIKAGFRVILGLDR